MQLSGINPGDIVLCDVRGDRFYALVEDARQRGVLAIAPLMRRPIPTYHATSRQVVGHWRKSKQSRV